MKQLRKILIVTISMLLAFQSTVYAADYKVVTNDSLYKIGQLFHVSVNTLKVDNFLKGDALSPGQIIKVPAVVYTVKSGDTLKKIANKYKVTVASIKKANHNKSSLIKVGQRLIIPRVNTASNTGSVIPAVSKANSTGTVISCTNAEVDLLARLIEAEAGGESYQAKVGVGAVVINRVQSKEWAPTITDVIYQKFGSYYQFTPVKIGTINNKASDASLRAAREALSGSDPSKGAIYYFDDTSTNQWLWAKAQTAKLDHMVFVK